MIDIPETIDVTVNLQIDTESWQNFRDKGMPDSEIRAELRNDIDMEATEAK